MPYDVKRSSAKNEKYPIWRSIGAAVFCSGMTMCCGFDSGGIEAFGGFSSARADGSSAGAWAPQVEGKPQAETGGTLEDKAKPNAHRKGNGGVAAGLPATAAVPGSSNASFGYDISRKMVQLHLKLGHAGSVAGRQERGLHPGSWMDVFRGSHAGKQNFKLVRLHPGERESWEANKSLQMLQQSINATEGHYQRAMSLSTPGDVTVVPKTRLGLGELDYMPTEILGVSLDDDAIKHAELLGFKAERVVNQDNGTSVVRLTLPPDVGAIRAQALLSNEIPGIRFELNKIYRLYRASMYKDLQVPNQDQPVPSAPCDPERCFSHSLIQWRDELAVCAQGVKVGIIDTGFDFKHPAFRDIHGEAASFTPDNRPAAPDWHGTGVLAILAGHPSGRTPGLIPGAEFYAASIFYLEEGGAMATDTISLLNALQWMKDKNVKIVNMSFSGPEDMLVKEALAEMSKEGTIFVAAAGNEGPLAEPAYPAAYPQVIAVTAITKDRRNYWYANRGKHIDVSDPGVDIWTAVPGEREGFHSGTSFAAPYATAIISLILPSLPQETLIAGKGEILAALPYIDLGPPGRDNTYGRGLLVAPSFCTPAFHEIASADR